MQGSSPFRVPKDGICLHWRQIGRCRFAGAGLECLEGTHPIEFGKKARDTAAKKSDSKVYGDKMELVYASR
jgi:hypothetical protein